MKKIVVALFIALAASTVRAADPLDVIGVTSAFSLLKSAVKLVSLGSVPSFDQPQAIDAAAAEEIIRKQLCSDDDPEAKNREVCKPK